jgi:hypothetical protein
MAELANNRLAEACKAYPDRFTGLTAIAPQHPDQAAEEIHRGHALGPRGVIVNSHTEGEYLDDQNFWPIFEACKALGTPVYLHPNTPPRAMIGPLLEAGLDGAIFGFGVETGFHLLRIITSGVFDRFPRLKLVVGHLGEALPFWMYRLDFMHAASVQSGRYEQNPGTGAQAQRVPPPQRVGHHQRHGVAARDPVLPGRPRSRPGPLRDRLPVRVRRRRGPCPGRDALDGRGEGGVLPTERRDRLRALSSTEHPEEEPMGL